ncbi:hypothetical protein ASPZODRAFT_131592 [Penicilliopsis zonata CBS 506.65]|uniref:Sister chromatid cohesion protein n=1 Tax=Penicilliopsis zonata CBS 506.65 TaxID=1073090 RepID=A0A1L9SL76_9EURO|nr:hypothetical protein ASPZODRAFT_131592 [Penicilliopsis zonata CBS 506.65]OJJ47969.1 hypothetical protein ASPZODRAFT_131592 [Penicilliopsis zonata CBS 506.65]
MDQTWHPAVQVVINGPSQAPVHSSNGPSQRLGRPLPVDEALKYSPMSSAPVFGLDSILRPDVGRSSSTAPINHIIQAGRTVMNDLDSEIRSGKEESARLETSREYLQQLLHGDQLTEFKFKAPTGGKNIGAHRSNSSIPDGPLSDRKDLAPFAKMMLESTDIAFRYSTPTNAKSQSQRAAFSHQPTISVNQPPSQYHKTPQFQSQPEVVIPVKPVYIHSNTPGSPKRRKLNGEGEEGLVTLRLKAQKEEADAALLKLQDLLHEVFEAEDKLEPDTSAAPTNSESFNSLFTGANALETNGLILSSDAHTHLQKAMKKVASFKRLQDIPSDYFNRIQKLCERCIMPAQTPDLKLDDPSNETECQEWLRKLDDMFNSLLAISTLLLTMSGRQTERGLCPEDLIEAIPTVLNQTFDNCIIPAVESRPGGKDAQYFQLFAAQKRTIGNLIHQSKKALTLFADFISRIDISEGTITAIEFFAAKLIFVENSHNDKDSAVGYQKYESLRRSAMDILAKIFSKYPVQRPFILDEILVSLEKLPSTRQSARQFKLVDGKNIQLLTALVLQLVQTTALEAPSSRTFKSKRQLAAPVDENGSEDEDDELLGDGKGQDYSESDEELSPSEASLERLATKVNRLYDNAVRSAQYIVKFIVQRAMTSTKTGDQPYRNILDLFTEDLINVLGSTDWPGAELLLRILASHMIGIADLDKSPATAKSMALELLGWMGSAISDLAVTAQHLIPAMEESDSDLTEYLRQLFDDHSRRALHAQDLIVPNGPYRVTLEYLLQDRSSDNWQLTSARGYYLAQWAKTICSMYYNADDKDEIAPDSNADELVDLLTNMFSDSRWLETHKNFNLVSNPHGRFAYILTVLNMSFCKAFDTILKVLLNSITSDQAKVRSRSLKSVIYMLEKDPSLLDRDASVMRVILRCATDASPMVRDSALSLIAKCIVLKPGLEEEGCWSILACAADPTAGVRKRCMALLKDIYLRTSRTELRLAILDSFLQRTGDTEDSVATIARQTFEEIWLAPFYESIDSVQDGPRLKVALGEQVDLLVKLVQRSEPALETLGASLKTVLSSKSKSASSNFKVCKAMVSMMFEKLVEDTGALGKEHQQALLQTITVFAKANAKTFSPDQLEALHPYIGHLVTADDLFIFRSVVVIYSCVLPYLSSSHNTLLKEVQNDLFKSVAKLGRSELNEVMACLWTINGVLQNTERLVKLTISVLKGIQQTRNVDLSDAAKSDVLARARSYIRIAGCVGKHCDLEKYEPHFKAAFPAWKGGSVAGLMVDAIIPFTLPKQPLELRIMALESLGSICQSWPAQFGREESRRVLSLVFEEDNANLQNIVLKAFAEFFAMHEGKSEKSILSAAELEAQENTTRLGGSLKASDNDGAAALIAQHFLRNMLRVAQSRQDAYALTAIELIASINRQGLVHPKECAGVLVSLETSTVASIAKVAFDTHKMLHQQYESMFEREYMRAVQEAFQYQRDIVGDSNGALTRPYTAKLGPLFEIIKTSNSRYQKKFLSNLCSKVNFELRDLDVSGSPPEHLLLSRFVSQNLAFLDYGQLTELHATIGFMERIVSSTGTVVAHAIETDIFPSRIEVPGEPVQFMVPTPDPSGNPQFLQPPPQNLRVLATAAASLSMLWEARSYLRRLYGVSTHIRNKDGKGTAKELNKAPTKVHGITGDKFWESIVRNMTTLDTQENMIAKCREFATLLAIDDEFKVSEEDADGDLDAPGDVDDMGTPLGASNGNRPAKRKNSFSGSVTLKRPRGRKPSVGRRRTSSEPDDELAWQ